MQVYILRCKNCGVEYEYGNRSDNGSTRDYCPECANAIKSALEGISHKFEPRPNKINEPRLEGLFSKLREYHSNDMPSIFPLTIGHHKFAEGFKNIEIFIHNGKKFLVRWNDKYEDHEVLMYQEYDLVHEKFTGRIWKYGCKDSYQKQTIPDYKSLNLSDVEPIPMSQPSSKLFYLDPISNFKSEGKIEKPKHILRSGSTTDEGWYIKSSIDKGRLIPSEGVDVSDLHDFIDYEYDYEYYLDEDFRTIKSIKCA